MKYRQKDHTNADRQRRFREKKKKESNGVTSLRVTQAEAEAEANKEKNTQVACPLGVSQEVWSDFLKHRKNLKSPLTNSAWKRMHTELRSLEHEDGWNPDDVLCEVMSAGWRSFKAEWLRGRTKKSASKPDPTEGAI